MGVPKWDGRGEGERGEVNEVNKSNDDLHDEVGRPRPCEGERERERERRAPSIMKPF